MSFRASLKNLIRRDPAASLRERAASLQTDLARVARQPAVSPTEPAAAPDPRDAELLALAPEWEAARDALAEAIRQQEAITDAAMEDGAPGPAPAGSGSDWRAWFERSQDWRQRTGVDAAEEVSGAACRVLGAIEDRIAALPAASLAGLRLKAGVAQRHEDIDLTWPEKLGEGLTRDLLAFTAATDPGSVEAATLAALGRPRGPDPVLALIEEHRTAYAEWDRLADVWSEMLSSDPGYAEAVAASKEPGKREVAAYEALFAAQPATLPGVLTLAEYLHESGSRVRIDINPSEGERGLATVVGALRAVLATREEKTRRETSLVGMLDLASASISELRAYQDIAEHVGAVAYAYTWGPRCGTRDKRYGGVQPNGIGQLMHWLGDALTEVETAADNEARRRQPSNRADRETRLFMLAGLIIDNGDPDQIEAFARELLAHAEAERRGR